MKKVLRWRFRAEPMTHPVFDELGLDPSALPSYWPGASYDTAVPAFKTQPDGSGKPPVAGLRGPHSLEQLRAALVGKDPRQVRVSKRSLEHRVAVFSDVNGIVLSERFLPSREFAWGDSLAEEGAYHLADYQQHFKRHLVTVQGGASWELARSSMAELRSMATRYEGGQGLRSKKALVDFLVAKGHVTDPEIWPAYYGAGRLVLRADGPGLAATIIARLREAIDAGTLGVANNYLHLSASLFLFDARDESTALVAERVAHYDWIDARMAELAPVDAELRRRGWSWFALGRPVLGQDGQVTYHLNGDRSPRTGNVQPFGSYTLDELLAEKFVDDALARAERERQASRRARP